MNKYSVILDQLEKELEDFTNLNPKQKHLLLDSFIDHRKRYETDLKIIDKYFKRGKLLEVGSNPYHMTFCLKAMGIDIIGVDIEPTFFKKFLKENNLDVVKTNIETEKLPFKSNFFDFVIFNEVFEHLRINPIFALKEIRRVLKDGGILLLTTPNLYAIHKIAMFNLGKSINDAFDEFNKFYKYGYVGHIREYSKEEVKKFLEKSGFRVIKILYRNDYSFFRYQGFRTIPLKLIGLIVDLIMRINPFWSRHLGFIAQKN